MINIHFRTGLFIFITNSLITIPAHAAPFEVRASLGSPFPTVADTHISLSDISGASERTAMASASYSELYVKSTAKWAGATPLGSGSRMNNVAFSLIPDEAGPVDLLLNFDFDLTVHSPGPAVTTFDQAVSSVNFNFIATSFLYQNVGGNVEQLAHPANHTSRSSGLFEDLFEDSVIEGTGIFPASNYSGTISIPVRVTEANPLVRLTAVIGANSLAIGESGSLAELSFSMFDGDFVTYADGRAFDGAIEGIPLAAVPEPMSLALFGLGLAGLGFTRRKRIIISGQSKDY